MDSVVKKQQIQAKKQCTLPSVSKLNPSQLQGLVAEYIIEEMLLLSTPTFKRLVCGTAGKSSSNVQLPDRKSFTLFLNKAYDSMIAQVKPNIENSGKSMYNCRCVDS